ncbi:hypothetical protein CANARDRAFT_26756 [[Candida] arabinofermentans NRRL YB-2248]|uniref:Uncharacterized protein n=1 Tax=[Candida] arabinofermentans NRRL YB-2248 TaxID=983967 RepID=A0A1E4T6G8_9ASCO|nr:hypothetical protein CANARDRAFT_26756 [[Candida] arabinofermentans NRRL YB-2248]
MAFPIPATALYYAVILIISVFVTIDFDYLSIGPVLEPIVGFLRTEEEEVKTGLSKLADSTTDIILSTKENTQWALRKVTHYYANQNSYTTNAIDYMKPHYQKAVDFTIPYYSKTASFVTPYLKQLQNVLLSYLTIAKEFLLPYVYQIKAIILPYTTSVSNAAKGFYSDAQTKAQPFVAATDICFNKYIDICKPWVNNAINFFSYYYTLLSQKAVDYYSKYLVSFGSLIADTYSPFFTDVKDIYEDKLSPTFKKHEDTLGLAIGVISVCFIIPKVVAPILVYFTKDVHNLSQAINGRYQEDAEDFTEELISENGSAGFDNLRYESGGFDDGSAALDASVLDSVRASKGSASCRSSGQQNNNQGSNRTTNNSEFEQHQVRDIEHIFGELSSQQQSQQQQQYQHEQREWEQRRQKESDTEEAGLQKEGSQEDLNEIIIGSASYEITSDILSSQDPMSARVTESLKISSSLSSPVIVPLSGSLEISSNSPSIAGSGLIEKSDGTGPGAIDADDNNFNSASYMGGVSTTNSSSHSDSLAEPSSQPATLPLNERMDTFNILFNSPQRLTRSSTSVSNLSVRSGSNMLGLIPSNLFPVTSSPKPVAAMISETNVYNTEKISYDTGASSAQYLSDISAGKISPRFIHSSGSGDSHSSIEV